MYASRLCNVPTSPSPLLLFEHRSLPSSTRVLEPDRQIQQDAPHSTITFIESNGNLFDQVRKERVSRTVRVHRVVVVCACEDFYLRFATTVQHMGQLLSEIIPGLEQVHEVRP